MKILELFCGTKSISKAFKAKGHEIFTVDIDKSFNPDLCINIEELTAKQILKQFGQPDIIWASPPCTCFSVASIGTHWTGGKGAYIPKTQDAVRSMNLVRHTLKLIGELRPLYWFIENPRGVLRKMPFMMYLPYRHTVTYCQYNNTLVQELIFNMQTKKCPKCGEIKNIDEFYKSNSRKDGFSSWCKICDNQSHKNYVDNNKEKLREYDKEQYWKDSKKHRENRRKSNVVNADKIKIARKKHYEENKEEILQKDAEYYQNNKEHINLRNKKYYINNKDKFIFKARERKKKIKETKDGAVNQVLLNEMYELQNHRCSYCNCNLDESGKHLDHIFPLSKGGKHTIKNVHWICPKCNLSKNDKTEEEWLKKERMKPTDIWTNHPNPQFKPMCKNGDTCHESAPRGSKTGTQGLKGAKERGVIPKLLCEHIASICERGEKIDYSRNQA